MQQGDLTTLAKVKDWLNTSPGGPFPGTEDAFLGRLITSASMWTLSYLQRVIAPTQFNWITNGVGCHQLFLGNFPILSVSLVKINGVAVPASNPAPLGAGYMFDDTCIYLNGYQFTRGLQNVQITYIAGFQITDEAATIPASGPLGVDILSKQWISDVGIKFASNSVSLTKVTTAPAAGQYQITAANGKFSYVFNAADASKGILVTYGYVPEDLDSIVVELAGEAYKRRTRIGQNSQNLGQGMVVTFSTKDCSEYVKSILNNYRDVVPV